MGKFVAAENKALIILYPLTAVVFFLLPWTRTDMTWRFAWAAFMLLNGLATGMALHYTFWHSPPFRAICEMIMAGCIYMMYACYEFDRLRFQQARLGTCQ